MAMPVGPVIGHVDPRSRLNDGKDLVQTGEDPVQLDRLDQGEIEILGEAVILEPAAAQCCPALEG